MTDNTNNDRPHYFRACLITAILALSAALLGMHVFNRHAGTPGTVTYSYRVIAPKAQDGVYRMVLPSPNVPAIATVNGSFTNKGAVSNGALTISVTIPTALHYRIVLPQNTLEIRTSPSMSAWPHSTTICWGSNKDCSTWTGGTSWSDPNSWSDTSSIAIH